MARSISRVTRDHRRSSKLDKPPTPVIPPGHLEQLRTHRTLPASAVQATGVVHPLRDLVAAW
jgi:hypothetical protein